MNRNSLHCSPPETHPAILSQSHPNSLEVAQKFLLLFLLWFTYTLEGAEGPMPFRATLAAFHAWKLHVGRVEVGE